MGVDIEGRVALVTGGGSGIGEAVCRALGNEGARIGVLDRDLAAAEHVASAVRAAGVEAIAVECDVSLSDSVDVAVFTVVDRFGSLQIAVNNAGTGLPATRTGDLTDDQWRQVLSVNLDGVFFCMRAELRAMQHQGFGAIVNVASVLSAVGSEAGTSAYTASKHGVLGITRNAALEYASDGIRINAVGPGYIATPLVERMVAPSVRAQRERDTPLGRLGTPDEIAALVLWLAGDSASFVTGAYFAADGGLLAR